MLLLATFDCSSAASSMPDSKLRVPPLLAPAVQQSVQHLIEPRVKKPKSKEQFRSGDGK